MVGAGIGGLSAAALLASAGHSVAVFEQGEKWGGYAQSITSGPYTFDPAVHVFPQGGDAELPAAMLRYLGVADRCRMLPAHANYSAVFPGLVFHAPFGLEEFIEAHVRAFPREAAGIDRFFRLCRQVHREAHQLPPQIGLANLDAVAAAFPTLVRYLRATVESVLDECLVDYRLKALCSVLWPYPGCVPSRLSFVTFATTVSVYLDGGFYCEGSFQSLADAFAAAVSQHGGEIVLRSLVTKITVDGDRAAGVVLADGSHIGAGVVISNADARKTLDELVGPEHLPAPFMRRLRRMHPSLSATVVFAAAKLDLDPAFAHEIFRARHFNHDHTHRDMMDGRPGGMWASVPTVLDPSLAPPGEHIISMTCMARYDIDEPWPDVIESYADEVIDEFECVFPGLRGNLTFVTKATPLTLESLSLNTGGAAYAWENTPAQSGGKRTPHQPPLAGLFFSGAWTQPGSGSLRAIVSGMHTAQLVLAAAGADPLDFEHTDLPPADQQ
ncbi:MAG TPA: NAD(P)/FAD-dependent oxidoreductase [Solirubrobacteraceae bacterium]|nr:NAD(P)/FAD-dependent oxidoreductase [Solirubrobacteraceae bacterium]